MALETLAARSDRNSWRVLADFATATPENLDLLAAVPDLLEARLQIEPRLWEYIQRQYAATVRTTLESGSARQEQSSDALEKGDALPENPAEEQALRRYQILGLMLVGGLAEPLANDADTAALQKSLPELCRRSILVEAPAPPNETVTDAAVRILVAGLWRGNRLWELNPRFKDANDAVRGQPLRVVRTPPLWTERRLMANLPRAIRSGDPRAIEFFSAGAALRGR